MITESNKKCERVTREHYAQLREQITREFGEQVLGELELIVTDFITWEGCSETIGRRLHYLRIEYLVYWRKAYNVKRTKRVRKLDKKTRKHNEKSAINKMRMRSKTRKHYNELCKTIENEFGQNVLVDLQTKAFVLAYAKVVKWYPEKTFRQCNGILDADFYLKLKYMRELFCDTQIRNRKYNIHTTINDNRPNCMIID